MKYKVLISFSYGFEDVWQLDDKPHSFSKISPRFDSIEEAETEIKSHIKSYNCADRSVEEGLYEIVERSDYKIVGADTSVEVYDYIEGC